MVKVGKPKGSPKSGGRVKGTPNKVNAEIRSMIKLLAEEKFDTFKQRMEGIEKDDLYCRVYLEMIKFVVPALQSVDVTSVKSEELTSITQQIVELSKKSKL